MTKRKYIVYHYICEDNSDIGLGITKVLKGSYETYAVSEAQAERNIQYRLGISLCPYDIGFDRSQWHDLEAELA